MTNFASEMARVFSNGCSVKNTDWNKPKYFDSLNNECYKKEAALMSSLTSEAYNKFGFEVQYFIKKISTKADKLLGEDPLENVERRFRLNVYTESVPQLQRTYELQGMTYDEIVTVQCTIEHFEEASQVDFVTGEPGWESVVPKIGDIMYFSWCDMYYEVLNAKTFAEGTSFLSTPMTYQFNLRVWRNSHESVDLTNVNDDKMEHLQNYVSLAETFDMNHQSSPDSPFEHITEPKSEEHELPTSKVKAEGDILSVNNWLETEEPQQAMSKKPEYDMRKTFDPFDGW